MTLSLNPTPVYWLADRNMAPPHMEEEELVLLLEILHVAEDAAAKLRPFLPPPAVEYDDMTYSQRAAKELMDGIENGMFDGCLRERIAGCRRALNEYDEGRGR